MKFPFLQETIHVSFAHQFRRLPSSFSQIVYACESGALTFPRYNNIYIKMFCTLPTHIFVVSVKPTEKNSIKYLK